MTRPNNSCFLSNNAFGLAGAEDRDEDDFHVEPEGPVLDVPEIVFYTFCIFSNASVSPPSVDLGPAGDAGFNGGA